jgi:GntR family transcriptional regulator
MTSSRFAQIANDLRERIALGELGEDGSVESEAELCRRYEVSRPTVRRALDLLRDHGLVEARHGAGWFATGTAFHQRLALGTFRHADSAVTEAGKSVRRHVVDFGYRDTQAAPASSLQLGADEELLYVQSLRTVEGDPLDVVHEWVPAELASAISRADATAPGIWATLVRHGSRIVSVRQTITAGAASDADAELLSVDPGTPLLLIRRLAIGATEQPLALSDHRYLAHRFALEVEFNSGPGSAAVEPPGLRALDFPTAVPNRSPAEEQIA